jgi:hypothetical protein
MKIAIAIALLSTACGCQNMHGSWENPALRSERGYAEAGEARAQALARTGQASSLSDARAQAGSELNAEWAAAAKSAERRAGQQAFEKDLSRTLGGRE